MYFDFTVMPFELQVCDDIILTKKKKKNLILTSKYGYYNIIKYEFIHSSRVSFYCNKAFMIAFECCFLKEKEDTYWCNK